ncbi:hypothetical protein GJW-30_1_03788 [Variibacter gotjawalensis]|uniref:Uncharacterized protein n=1 Tax=Variibacter gotjawalensis TaxID=1333996 RepID=A0A0S3PZ77_9BRAD|nr:hypothetical protein [Variibacter gotjawalensis]RZS48973.1 hypothetical protein EV661_1396 [Variibacter gotjawalensis]BAT61231.1 hypothetical protein GJW-30_1_03788 [Variibacter gotjawalensis]
MTTFKTIVNVRHPIIFLRESVHFTIPVVDTWDGIWTTSTCVISNCQGEVDGDAHIALGFGLKQRDSAKLVFDGTIETPSRALVLETTVEELTSFQVLNASTRVRVWTDGSKHSPYIDFELVRSTEPT